MKARKTRELMQDAQIQGNKRQLLSYNHQMKQANSKQAFSAISFYGTFGCNPKGKTLSDKKQLFNCCFKSFVSPPKRKSKTDIVNKKLL
jgi:hypothetical protein